MWSYNSGILSDCEVIIVWSRHKEGWLVGLGQDGGCMKVGETTWNALKGAGTEKNREETKILKMTRGGHARSRGGYLKRKGGRVEPLYKLWVILKCVNFLNTTFWSDLNN